MPYPFVKLPTFGEFRAVLEEEFDCEYKQLDQMSYEDPQGAKHPIFYIERKVGQEVYLAAVDVRDNDVVQLTLLRSICGRLRIRLERFGLHLE